jgi:hypothetical protein
MTENEPDKSICLQFHRVLPRALSAIETIGHGSIGGGCQARANIGNATAEVNQRKSSDRSVAGYEAQSATSIPSDST